MKNIQKLVKAAIVAKNINKVVNSKSLGCIALSGALFTGMLSIPQVIHAETQYTERVVFDISGSRKVFSSLSEAKSKSIKLTKQNNGDVFFVSPFTGGESIYQYKLPLDGNFYYHESSTPAESYYNVRGWQIYKISELNDASGFKGYRVYSNEFGDNTLNQDINLGSNTMFLAQDYYTGDIGNPVDIISRSLARIDTPAPEQPSNPTQPSTPEQPSIPSVPSQPGQPSGEQEDSISVRLGGSDRYYTSIEIAKQTLNGGKMKGVILASGLDFPDSLSASALSSKYDAPILLVRTSSSSSNEVLDFVYNNLEKDGQVIIVGGEGVIDSSFESSLKQKGFNKIKRLGGLDRYATNKEIVRDLNPSSGGSIFLSSSFSYADALSVSSVSAKDKSPIILSKENITEETKSLIDSISPNTVYIVGGDGVISKSTEDYLRTKYNVVRLGGLNRYETNKQVYNKFKNSGINSVCFASSNDFPDSLAGSYLAYKTNSMVLLVNRSNYNMYKDSIGDSVKTFYALGGDAVVPKSIIDYYLK